MTELDMKKLQPGDVIRGKNSQYGFIVTANYGIRVTAVRTVDMTNPSEWDLVVKANPELPSPGGHRFHSGVCECGQKPTDDPSKCTVH